MVDTNKNKKQVPLRLSKTLYDELSRWAEDDFRSINGQIEYLLTECVKKRRKNFGDDGFDHNVSDSNDDK
ncbi:MAG: PTS ascorbate transporter subunit IIC [Ruminococcaceae bacterium]|nr:PTS ascorbate transporter subunit IIC [Oscillospiraceae bacterium]